MGDKWLESFIGDAEENKNRRLVKQITVLSELEIKCYKKCRYMSNKFIFRRMSGENKERKEERWVGRLSERVIE